MKLEYQLVQPEDYAQTIEFALYTRQLLFPEIYHGKIPKDLENFADHYVNHPLGGLVIVKDANRLIGMVAYRAYNGRFDLEISAHAVEVVKLFVLPEYRRQGIASALCSMLFQHARLNGIQQLYLHTHPFLPAAELFWSLQGFNTIKREWIQTYDTIHMSKEL